MRHERNTILHYGDKYVHIIIGTYSSSSHTSMRFNDFHTRYRFNNTVHTRVSNFSVGPIIHARQTKYEDNIMCTSWRYVQNNVP